jgi:hypothetical protein
VVPVGFEGSPSKPIVSEASRVESNKAESVEMLPSQKFNQEGKEGELKNCKGAKVSEDSVVSSISDRVQLEVKPVESNCLLAPPMSCSEANRLYDLDCDDDW